MPISINNKLFGTKNGIVIHGDTPLSNPLRIGDQSALNGERLETQADVQEAYRGWMLYKIKARIKPVIDALNEIGEQIMDGKTVTLDCNCNSDWCHGYVIKQIIEDKINEA